MHMSMWRRLQIKRNTCNLICDQVVCHMMCFIVTSYMYCLGQRRTYATSRLLSFSTPRHPVCPCFLHSSPHMQHRVQCELARKPKIAGRRSKTSQRVHFFPSYRGDLKKSRAAQFLRRANFVKCPSSIALKSTKMFGGNLIPLSCQVGQCDKTALSQRFNRKPHLDCNAIERILPSQALATRSDRSATPTKEMRQHRVKKKSIR